MSKTLEEKIDGITWLALFIVLEPIKRVLSAVLYPVAYWLRGHLRFPAVMWEGYLYSPKPWPLWYFLDDSAEMEFKKEYANKPKYYPAFIWNTGSDFLRAYWWAAIRNSMVNWNNANAYSMGEMECEPDHTGKRNFFVMRRFKSGRIRPYCEFYVIGRWNQVGWIKKGRFEIDVMKVR